MKLEHLFRNHPLRALRALRALEADPDDLPQVFTIISNLPGRSGERLLERMRASSTGRSLLATRPNIAEVLADWAALGRLPEGSVGRAYLDFVTRAGISAQGIAEASERGRASREGAEPDLLFAADRTRDTHDLWHVVTGYETDVIGELSVLAFSYAQVKSPGVLLVLALGLYRLDREHRRVIWQGYRRGQSAAWLPALHWETLLSRPLEEVRKELGVGAPVHYTPLTTAELRSTGELAPRVRAA